MRSFIRQLLGSPVLQGLFMAFTVLAGLVLMAQGALTAWQTLMLTSPPDDVRVIDAQTILPVAQPTDVAQVIESAIESELPELEILSEPSGTLPETLWPIASTDSLTGSVRAPVDEAPLFGWELELDDPDDAPFEVVDAPEGVQHLPFPGYPTRIVIPSIRVDSPVITVNLVTSVQHGRTVSAWQVARNAVGYHNTSAPPGTQGNTVMSAHNNAWGRIFRNLINVKHGDVVELYVDDRLIQYEIADKILVRQFRASSVEREENASWIGPTTDSRLTLVSCWPYRRATHRVIIIARPVQVLRQ